MGTLGPDRRRFHLMQAYSQAQLHPGPSTELTALLDRARPAYPDEHLRFAAHWPELRAFLEAHPWRNVSAPETATLPRAECTESAEGSARRRALRLTLKV